MAIIDPRLEQIRERWEGVTLGDWVYHESLSMVYARPEFDIHRFDQMDLDIFKVQESKQDGVAVASSKADIRHLLSVVAEQAATIERVRAATDALDVARAVGNIHTYGAIQGMIRNALEPNQEATL